LCSHPVLATLPARFLSWDFPRRWLPSIRTEYISEEAEASYQAAVLAWSARGRAEITRLRRVVDGNELPQNDRDLVLAQEFVAAQPARMARLRRVANGNELPLIDKDLVRAQEFVAAQNANLAAGRETQQDRRIDVDANGDDIDADKIAWVDAQNFHLTEIGE
jgi:hypothetical protein